MHSVFDCCVVSNRFISDLGEIIIVITADT